MDLIRNVHDTGNKTIMLVEHNMNVVMSISDWITVMHQGQVLAEGTPAEIAANEVVQSAYLGGLVRSEVRDAGGCMMENGTSAKKSDDIHTHIGQFHILQGVTVEVPKGSIVALLGRNGAGKTTTLKSILGLTPPRKGKILFDGQEIQGQRSFDIAAMGIGFVPEHRAIFRDLSVPENLKIAERNKGDLARKEEFSLFAVPRPETPDQAAGHQPVWRPAADAGRGPRPGARQQAAAHRRAQRGVGARSSSSR